MPVHDPAITRVIEEAHRITKKKQRTRERWIKRHQPKPFFPLEIERHRAYRAMYPFKPTEAWGFSLVGAFLLYGLSWLGEIFPYDRFVSIAIIACVIAWGIVRALILPTVWYFRRRGWRSRLPCTVVGWETCLGDSRLLNRRYWKDITITVTSSVQSAELKTALEATLMLFCRTMRTSYYASDSSAPSRSHWTSTTFSATGSANNRIFGMILELLRGRISRIARSYQTELVVTLTPTKDYYYVKPDPLGGGFGIVP